MNKLRQQLVIIEPDKKFGSSSYNDMASSGMVERGEQGFASLDNLLVW